jgi:acetyl esterase/lipase
MSSGAYHHPMDDFPPPRSAARPAIVLIHGGFWRARYDRALMENLAQDLIRGGWMVANIEYRRIGNGGGWPATFDDVLREVDRTPAADIVTIGHSAGGHLAFWVAAERGIAGAVSQAGVLDLRAAHMDRVGGSSVTELLGGTPLDYPDRYKCASPSERLPLRVPQLVLHGDRDGDVPVAMSRRYVEAARAAGDDVEYVELGGVGHYEHLDPRSEAWLAVRRWLDRRWT